MKLSDLYPNLSKVERVKLAKAADILPGYLYQIATRWRGRKASLQLINSLAAADRRLTVKDMVDEFTTEPDKASA